MRFRLTAIVVLVFVLRATSVFAQVDSIVDSVAVDTIPEATVAPVPILHEPVPVIVNGRTVVALRAEIGKDTPEERAVATRERVLQILLDDRGGVVDVKEILGGRIVSVDGRLAVFLAPGDIDTTMGESIDTAAAAAQVVLQTLVAESRELASITSWIWTAAQAAIAFVLFVVLLRLLWWARKKLTALILSRIDKSVSETSYTFRQILHGSNTLPLLLSRLVVILTWVFTLLIVYVWLTFTLKLVPLTRAWGEEMSVYIFSMLRWFVDGVINAIPGLMVVLFIFLVARSINRFLATTLSRIENGSLHFSWIEPESVRPTRQILRVVVWLFAIAFAYPYIPGSSSDAFKGVSVVAGLMLSLGASSSVGQALSGLVLMYSRTIKVGEFVKIGDNAGTITRIGFFQTWLRTPFHEEISMPSSVIANSTVVNYTRLLKDGLSFSTTLTIGYDTPWRQVHQMLLEAARRTEQVAAQPAPLVSQGALQDFYVEYKLTVVVADRTKRNSAVTSLLGNIQDVFNENDVQIMSPHYVADPSQDKVVDPTRRDPGIKGAS